MTLVIEAANAAVAVAGGVIVAPTGTADRVLRIPGAHIRPGLINAHDHLHRNHYGRLGGPPYANAYDWATDIQARYAAKIAQGRTLPRRQALLRGAWKNLLAGVTHVVHHDPWELDFEIDFPLHVVPLASADSLGMTPGQVAPTPGRPFALHIAEGVDRNAAEEVRTLAARGHLTPDFLAVHAVGPDADGVARLRACGCAMVWCPTSNQFLFGRSAPAALLADGIDVLLGTDSLLTGTGNLLDELRAARGTISDARLLEAVGGIAARRLGLPQPTLAAGTAADLIVLRRPLLEANAEDIALVMVAGRLRVLDPALVAAAGVTGGRVIESGGVRRWISEEAHF